MKHYSNFGDLKDILKLLRNSKQVHSNWYLEQYPDVAELGMHPAEHYLKFGAEMGRDPGKGFSTRYYLENYPEVSEMGMNPLLHYVLHGQKKGYKRRDWGSSDPKKEANRKIGGLRSKLMSLGFTAQPLAEFEELMVNGPDDYTRTLAARELALWNMRERTEEGYRRALEFIARGRKTATLEQRARFATIELLCHYFLGDLETGRAFFEKACLKGEFNPHLLLAWVNFHDSPEERCLWINQALRYYNISEIGLLPDTSVTLYDRLCPARPVKKIHDGPKVSVLLAAYCAAEMIPTALRSLQEQSWQNIEVLVLDDCSPDDGAMARVVERYAAEDPRIRLIRMEQNGGAYVARNRGLDEATGELITIHDADDWSHPLKIETQVRYLMDNPEVLGCTSQQARATESLNFTKFPHNCDIVRVNVSSFMYRRRIMDELGYWATTRFAADSELIFRIRKVFGEHTVHNIPTGPLSFQRESDSSIVKNDIFGIDGFYYGVRHEFFSASSQYIRLGGDVRYPKDVRNPPFKFPNPMRPNRKSPKEALPYDVIIASDFRMPGGSVLSCLEELKAMKQAGLRCAVFCMYRYDLNYTDIRRMTPEVRQFMLDEQIDVLSYGEIAECDLLLLRYPPILEHPQRYIPEIRAKAVKVIVNQPPMSDYTETGVVRYRLENCARNLREQFGQDAIWYPIGPLVRDALTSHHAGELQHIELSPENWHNIIDIKGWDRGPGWHDPGRTLRIGRHSRDNAVKWPATREDILAVYPERDDIEVHVLGGASAPAGLIGHLPDNWIVHEFGALHPRDFLADLDVFVYFAHPDWVESFGRTIIEAMAVGLPVILPHVYEPLFKEAALYATVETAVDTARRLHADPEAYRMQVERARRYAAENFSYETHIRRVKQVQEQ
ncbi:glycosyltransferase [Pseudoponticoccus marisrubri]|uniref:Glycosyltransferase 2-like domain-containing protein n=1 Tax=Pseudoponticoccus marisrubri TaxID=1685382 RepID=A0A0W7WEF4_9RHOB|nr:glycosyltransferase [Pseudoponticoccus marisrubri]KUF08986.1 hypothetical protein AVJ23_20060 [Pseudoponticoccus marisrubri]